MGNPDDDLLMREINAIAARAAEIAPKTLDIDLYAAALADQFTRDEEDIRKQLEAVFFKNGLFWDRNPKPAS